MRLAAATRSCALPAEQGLSVRVSGLPYAPQVEQTDDGVRVTLDNGEHYHIRGASMDQVNHWIRKNAPHLPGPLQEDKIVNIPPKLGLRDIADLLVKEGVIDHTLTFIIGAKLAETREELRFGEYQFAKQSSLHDVINTIVEGKVVQHQITIAEGLTSEQIVQRLLETDRKFVNSRQSVW
jgi:hypothetical protein